MSLPGFKLFEGTAAQVEAALNMWAETLPPGTRIRRTQLAAAHLPLPAPTKGEFYYGPPVTAHSTLFALVNYELPEPPG